MPRKNLIRSNNLPYHVTSRANNQEWFSLPIEIVWDISLRCLKEANEKYHVEVISFVLMSNHYHLLVRTPNADLDSFMYEFNKRLAFSLKDKSGNSNHLLGARYKWCLIQSQKYFTNCYRYIYQNPLRANLTLSCEHYPYSSLFYITKNLNFPIPLFDQMGFTDPHKLHWLNEKINEEEVTMIKKGLKRSELKTLVDKTRRKFAPATHSG